MGGDSACWQDPVEAALRDLISAGFEDVTNEVELYPGGEEAYVFRGPDGALYHCWSRGYVLSVLVALERVAGLLVAGVQDSHFFSGPDGVYHCLVQSGVVLCDSCCKQTSEYVIQVRDEESLVLVCRCKQCAERRVLGWRG